jgi:hypothetical protein
MRGGYYRSTNPTCAILTGVAQCKSATQSRTPGEAAFDKIVSVGMYEHVGLRSLLLASKPDVR